MLKTLLIAVALACAGLVQAADVDYFWDTDPTVQEYRVYHSVDGGATWLGPTVSPTIPVTVTVPDSGLVILRAANWSATTGEINRPEAGIWYNGDWKPVTPANMGTP